MGILNRVKILRRVVEIGYTMVIILMLSVIVGLILAFPVMWLWNFLVGDFCITDINGVCIQYFNLKINVFQAWALNILAGIIFGKASEASKA